MNNHPFYERHIGINEQDEARMLRKIGVGSLDELIDKTLPANIRLKAPLDLPEAMDEHEFAQHIGRLAAQNKLYATYIGQGWYGTITPAVIQRNIFENPVWYTSYTPYQTEVSQGRLEALMNFQTVICDLTGMPLANCSLLDEGTAAAEAVTMMHSLRPREQQKAGASTVFVDESIFPQTLAVMRTRAVPQGITLRTGKYSELEFTPDLFACVVQYPNAQGSIEDYRAIIHNDVSLFCLPVTCRKFDAVCAPFYYEKAIERAVHRFKFEDKDFLARPFAQEIASAVHRDFAQQPFDVVTFIPFTKRQARSRAFNPSELLARETAKVLALPCVPLLEKLFETETQHHLSQTARTGNVFGVYEVKDAAAVQDKHILLVDDIKTTGATLSECAKVLKLAGACSVHAAVFAVAKKKKGKTAHGSSGSGENTGSGKGL